MNTFSFTCLCGEKMTVEAQNKKGAITKLKARMSQDAIDTHFAAKHPDEPVPAKEEVYLLIEEHIVAA